MINSNTVSVEKGNPCTGNQSSVYGHSQDLRFVGWLSERCDLIVLIRLIRLVHIYPTISFRSDFLRSERKGRRAAPEQVSLARKYKSTRTVRGHSGADNNIMGCQKVTVFASVVGVRRCGDQAFFDK